MTRKPFSLRRLALPIALLIIAQALLVAAPLGPQAGAQEAATAAPIAAALTPLESVLNSDGTLQAGAQLNGSIDTTGWQMQIDADGAPRFVREGAEQAQPQQASSGAWITNYGAQSGVVEDIFIGNPGWLSNDPNVIAVDGSDIYIGGRFNQIVGPGGLAVNNIARWNSLTRTWSDLGGGLDGEVHAIKVVGDEVYVGGAFNERIRRWSKTNQIWSSLGNGIRSTSSATAVYTIAVGNPSIYGDGVGLQLFIGGLFSIGSTIRNIARWELSTGLWYPIGPNAPNGSVKVIQVDSSRFFAGGSFDAITNVGGANYRLDACKIAYWDGFSQEWSTFGKGLSNSSERCDGGEVKSMVYDIFDLYVGGSFKYAGGSPANALARLGISGTGQNFRREWYSVGGSITGGYPSQGEPYVTSLALIGNGPFQGNDLLVSGSFSQMGGVQAYNVARWHTVSINGSPLYWSAMGAGLGSPVQTENGKKNGEVNQIVVANGAVYATGRFTKVSGVRYINIAKWDGTANRWDDLYGNYRHNDTALGSVLASTIINLPGDSRRFPLIGGQYTHAATSNNSGSDIKSRLYHLYDGFWRELLGFDLNAVYTMAVDTNKLYIGGAFGSLARDANSGGIPWTDNSNIAVAEIRDANTILAPTMPRPLGTGTNGPVDALAVDGTLLYAGGRFSEAGGVTASNIARWHTALKTWSPLGTGVNGDVYAIAVSGSDVYVGGKFTQAGGIAVSNIARWNSLSETWSAVGSGMDGQVETLAVSGERLYVGGRFSTAGGVASRGLAVWDGLGWSSIGAVEGDVRTIAVDGDRLYIGGLFSAAGGIAANNIAIWDSISGIWKPLGSGTDGAVETIGVAGSNVIVGGQFDIAGGVAGTKRLARYTYNPIPQIDSLTPGEGRNDRATTVTISGRNFTTSPTAQFNGAQIAISSASDTQIVATVPAGTQPPCDYSIGVTNSYGERASRSFRVLPSGPPVINSIEPQQVNAGSNIVLRGVNLVCSSQVFIGGKLAGYTSWYDNSTVNVPVSLPKGIYDLTIVTPAGVSRIKPGAIEIISSPTVPPAGPFDVELDSWELTQGIQSLANDVPLVANRRTVLRVYGRMVTGQLPRQPTISLYGTRNGQPLPGSPLRAMREDGIMDGINKRVTIDSLRGSKTGGWMFWLPSAWTEAGSIQLRAVLQVSGDTNTTNNERSGNFRFTRKAPICLKLIPIRTLAPKPNTSPNSPGVWLALRWVEWLFPTADLWTYQDSSYMGKWLDLPYELPEDSLKLLDAIKWRTWLENDPPECGRAGARTVYVGVAHQDTPRQPAPIPPSTGTIGASLDGTHAMWFFVPPDESTTWTSETMADTIMFGVSTRILAHELGHQYGRGHIRCPNTGTVIPLGPYDAYPYLNICDLSDPGLHYGFNPLLLQPVNPTDASDIMSYQSPQWISAYTFSALYREIRDRTTTSAVNDTILRSVDTEKSVMGPINNTLATARSVVLLSGVLTPTLSSGTINHVLTLPVPTTGTQVNTWIESVPTKYVSGLIGSSLEADVQQYHLRFLGANGQLLDDRIVSSETSSVIDQEVGSSFNFGVVIPAPEQQVEKIELWDGERLLSTLQAGISKPIVNINTPITNATTVDELIITWSASDQDESDRLSHTIQYSPNNGQTWQTLALHMPDIDTGSMSYTINDLSHLPGSNQSLVRVLVSDGYNTTIVTSEPFQVVNRKPDAAIIWPVPNAVFAEGEQVVLQGTGSDPEDGQLDGTALRWLVDGEDAGSGKELFPNSLVPGTHEIALTARDSSGNVQTTGVTIRVGGITDSSNRLYLPLVIR